MVKRTVAMLFGLIVVNWLALRVLAAETTAPVLERLDPPRRAAVVMALLGLVLTGLVLVTCVMLGAHWVRRLAQHKPPGGSSTNVARNTAETARLRESLETIVPDIQSGDTVQINRSTKETKVDP
jgi:hypothetical protein